ncbi:MAG: hypothetical protein ACYCVZ_01690 [Streptosporangiaceae bacterium]
MAALAVLAGAAAVVSWAAQYQMVLAVKHMPVIAALEAGIPDAGALIFASLGIALALHGKHAIRARVLNLACVATSVGMNALAAGRGWRDIAIWVMPPLAYMLASDTMIGVVRAWAIARQKALNEALADDGATPLAVIGGLLLWLLRLTLAPRSTADGFRRWVQDECPVAPGRRPVPAPRRPALQAGQPTTTAPASAAVQSQRGQAAARSGSKTAQFLALVEEQHGPLAALPLHEVSKICTALAPEVGLHPGSARSVLRRTVRALQNGDAS